MAKVAILLSTYNGEKYLDQLLQSIYNQTYKDFVIIARDDGSADNSVNILKKYNIEVLDTKRVGVKESYNILLKYALKKDYKYFMFCDQDDIWKNDKIEITLNKMEDNKPILVHTDLEVVDENLNIISSSFFKYTNLNPSLNSLNRLLFQNTVTGCTIMINRKLANLIDIPNQSIMFDWWIALVASSFGEIKTINKQTILYRQHLNNTIGANKLNINFDLNKYIQQAKAFLIQYNNILTKGQKEMLEAFINLNRYNFLYKRYILFKYKFFKQGIKNIGLFCLI